VTDRRLINKRDILIIIILILTALIIWLCFTYMGSYTDVRQAEIVYNNSVIKVLDLSVDGQYTVPEAPDMVFEVKDGKARVLSSDCPDKVCVNSGWLSRAGQCAVCLPNRITLRLTPTEQSPDAVL
jgi:hypothetical protein